MLTELMPEMYARSRLLVLDFANIPAGTPRELDISQYFADCQRQGVNPRAPENRQKFNNSVLRQTGTRYLVSQYCEDRAAMLADTNIAKEGRTYHLGIDIFSQDLEPVFAPCDGTIVDTNYEAGFGEYGHYLVFQPNHLKDTWFFFGHLSGALPAPGTYRGGEQIARLGDYAHNENGGWSRHLHFQVLREYNPGGDTPIGYSTAADLTANTQRFPDPMAYFPKWQVEYVGMRQFPV